MNATIARHTILPWHRRHHHYAYADVYRIGVRYFASTIPLLRDNGNGNGGINNICLRQHQRQPLLPIATFIDLDTIAPKTIRRSDARAIIGPLIEFERRVNQQHHVGEKNDLSKSGSLLKVEAFGNIKSIINKHKYGNGNGNNGHATMDNNNNGPEPMTAFTGSLRSMAPEVIKRSYGFAKKMTILTDNTNSGTIYCSVCTCKLTLTDSDKKEDDPKLYTLLDKYKAHMQLHGKEQEKLIHKMHARQRIHKKKQHNSHNSNSSTTSTNKKRNRKKIKNILTPKEMNRYYKYKRAREELNLIEEQIQLLKTNTGSNNGNTSNNGKQYQQQRLASSPNNKLKVVSRDESFNTLRDFGIKVHAVRRDVNEALVSAADGWMTDVFVQSGGNCGGNGVGNDIRSTHSSGNHATISDNNSTNTMEESENRKKDTNKHCYNGVLIVYSKDSIALAPLFQRAKDRGILTVSACNEVTNNNSSNSNHSASSYFSSSRSDDVVDIQLGPFGKWVEDDVVTTATPLDIDYFSSSLSDDGSSTTSLQHSSIKECSNNENDDGDGDGDEEGYIVKTVQSAPISLLLSSSPNKTSKKKQAKRHAMGAYAAIPVSDNGLRFMNERIEGGKEHDCGTLPTAAAAWLLAPSVPTSALNSILKNHHDDTMGQQQQHGSIGESFFARAMNAVTGMFHTFTSNVASSANIFASVNTTPPIEEEKNDAPSQLYSNKREEEEDHETRSTKFYKCLRCGHQEEKWHRFNEFRKVECTRCSRRVRSLPRHKFVVYSPENNNAENDDDDASPFATGAERRKSTQRRYNNNNRRPMNKRGGSTRQRRPLMGGSGMFVPYLYRQTNKP